MVQTTRTPAGRVGVGIIGAGSRGVGNLARNLCNIYPQHHLHITALQDNHRQRLRDAKQFVDSQHATHGITGDVRTYDDMAALVADPTVDLVMITTPQYAHEQPFQLAAEAGKLIYCDKPLAASADACDRMLETRRRYRPRVTVGFTRRYEATWRKVAQLLSEGVVGTPHMMLLRAVLRAERYFHKWMRYTSYSGGLLNEKSSHHFDVFNWYSNSRPVQVYAQGGRRVFTPREGYPKYCRDCDRDCQYRRDGVPSGVIEDSTGPTLPSEHMDDPDDVMSRELCVYSPEADIVDHAIVNVQLANGMSACLFETTFGQATEDQETIEIVGDRGRINLSRFEGRVDVITNFGEERQHYDCRHSEFDTSHKGADLTLIRELSRFATDGVDGPVGIEAAHIASTTAFLAERSIKEQMPLTIEPHPAT